MAKLKIPAAILTLLLGGATAYQVLDVAIPAVEGNPTVAYADVGGVPTICAGVTKGVKLGDVETLEGCRRRNAEEIQKGLADVRRCIAVPLNEGQAAGLGLFAYNVGGGAFCRSTLAKMINQGRAPAEACAQLDRWVYVAGKDCRIASSGCAGIIHRRALERALCEW
jgi:lysozyme